MIEHLRKALDLLVWAQQRRQPITAKAIQSRFEVHRSTAHRWLASLISATGAKEVEIGEGITAEKAMLPIARGGRES